MATDFPSWDHLVSHIKSSEVILNRIGLVSKQRSDSSWKHRIIWDLRRSGVNSLTRQIERVILPRLEDVANDIMNLTRSSGKDERVFLLSTDMVDAFHQIPVHPSEQRFTATSVGGRCFLFRVLIFGSGSAPTMWGRFAAWLGRSTMCIAPSDVLLQIPAHGSHRFDKLSAHRERSRTCLRLLSRMVSRCSPKISPHGNPSPITWDTLYHSQSHRALQ